ncbi:cbb3-type cytochrome oxidase assembly protein CcoS [Helicobacter sp. T3_23-1056]
MNTPIITIMLIVSVIIGLIGLVVFLWGLRSGQFDDSVKITHGALFDSQEDLNLAYQSSLKSSLTTTKPKGEQMSENTTKLAIIGAGPGGIGAAIEAKIAGIDSILFEKTATHNATLNKFYKDGKRVDRDYKGDKIKLNGAIDFSDSNKEATLEMFGDLLEKHQINVAYQNDIESVVADDKNDSNFLINTSGGKSYFAQSVIIAIGKMGQPNKPSYKIPSSILRQVNYNANSVQAGEKLLIVGGGNSAVEYACEFAKSNDTTLNYRRSEFARINDTNAKELESVMSSGKLKTKLGIDIESLSDENGKINAHFTDGSVEVYDRAIYAIGGSSPVDFLKKCNIKLDENNLPIVDENLQSSVKGVFVIGDILFKSGASIACALSQAQKVVAFIAPKLA